MIPPYLQDPLGSEPGGVFFLHGDDDFRKRAAVDALVDAHLDPSTRDFNFDTVSAEDTDPESLAAMTGTLPMMAEWRVVLVRGVQAFAGNPRARGFILELAADPPDGLVLILEGTIPPRSKARFYGELQKAARSAGFPQLAANDVPGWVMEWARDVHGTEVEEDAARALGSALGTDLGVLAREVEKLAVRVGEGNPVTVDAVREAGTRLPHQDRWQWMDLVGEGRFREALEGLPVLLAHGETGVGLVIGLGTHLLRLGVALEGGASALEDVLPPRQRWLASRLEGQARAWSRGELDRAMEELLRADRLLKSSARSPEDILEEWLLRRAAADASAAQPAGRS